MSNPFRPYSYSQFRSFTGCPRRYYLAYELGLKLPPPLVLVDGSAYHAAVEAGNHALLAARAMTGEQLVEEYMRDLDARLMTEEVETTEREVKAARSIAPGVLRTYASGLYQTLRPAPNAIEKRFDVAWDMGTSQVLFCGVVDMIDANGTIVDYKSVARAHTAEDVRRSPQLHLYADQFKSRKVAHVQLVKKKSAEVLWTPAEVSDTEVANSKEWALEQVRAIEACRQTGVWPRCDRESWLCKPSRCGFYGICYRKGDDE